jgi:DNA polymerase I-like protein with 3'-5' exonuclease and polymerase domains
MIDVTADISEMQVPVRAFTPEMLKAFKYVEVGKVPNQHVLIVPDPGMTIVDMDLDRADAQFVAWEANDKSLKDILKSGEDLHLQNAKDIWGSHVTKGGPERKLAKRFCHAVNYGAYPKKLAKALGLTLKTAEWIYGRWFFLHPGIREWHDRVRTELYSKRLVRNPFGFERYYFDRPEQVVNQALSWCPQSAVGIIINKAWDAIDANLPQVEVLMQVHDSLTMQVPSRLTQGLLPAIQKQSLIVVPYEDPLIIPVGFKISEKSWGHAEAACCEEPIQKPPGDKCCDHALHKLLAEGLFHARAQAPTELAGSVREGI